VVCGHSRQIEATLRRIAVMATQAVRIDDRPHRGRLTAGRIARENEGHTGAQSQGVQKVLHRERACRSGCPGGSRAYRTASELNLLAVEGCRHDNYLPHQPSTDYSPESRMIRM